MDWEDYCDLVDAKESAHYYDLPDECYCRSCKKQIGELNRFDEIDELWSDSIYTIGDDSFCQSCYQEKTQTCDNCGHCISGKCNIDGCEWIPQLKETT